MAKKLNQLLGISAKKLDAVGAINIIIGVDSLFHIDPYLLRSSETPEFKESYKKFDKYFTELIILLNKCNGKDGAIWKNAVKKMTFKEIKHTNLGYSKKSNHGNAIGPKLASQICETAKEIINAGIKEPVIFELVGVFQDNVGADRISDMTANIILENILEYTQRIIKELNITKVQQIEYNAKTYFLPKHTEPVILLPKEILAHLPVARVWSEIDRVCKYNDDLRNKVNHIIGDNWKEATTTVKKANLKELLIKNPDLLKDLIDTYNSKVPKRYDFEKDPLGELRWIDISNDFALKNKIDLKKYLPLNHSNFISVITAICEKYAELIENNGLWQSLYSENLKPLHERFPQLLFFGIADSYCEANNIDISREPNAGRGPVDFKFSSGYESRINVELKYSINKKLLQGYTKQLEEYNKAEKTFHSIYLILKVSDKEDNIKKLFTIQANAKTAKKRTPDIIVVDARPKSSASKL